MINQKKIATFFVIIFLFSLINLYPSFYLGLSGDSWQMLWKYKTIMQSQNDWIANISLLFSSYGSFYLVMAFLNNLIGYQHIYYYLLAYILRLIAALSFFPLVYVISRNYKTALFASLFFSATSIGLEVTSWVFNMPTYLVITFLNLFLTFWVKFHKSAKLSNWLLSLIFFALSYISSPLRMVTIMPFLFLMEIYLLIKERKTYFQIKKISLFVSLVIVFFVFSFIVNKSSESISWRTTFQEGLLPIKNELANGRFIFLFYPLITVGKMLIPINLSQFSIYNSSFSLISSLILPVLSIHIILFLIIKKKNASQFRGKISTFFYVASVTWTLISIYLYKIAYPILSSNGNIIFLLLGGYFSIFWILFIYLFRNTSQIVLLLIISIFLTFTSFSHAWWRTLSIMEPIHRYLIISSVGITLFLSCLINISIQLKSKILLLIPSLILLLNIYSERIYLNQELDSHSAQIVDKLWSQIPYIPADKDYPLVFYFEGDGSNNRIIFESIQFGFPSHICLISKVENIKDCPYIPLSDAADLVALMRDGNSLKRFGYKLIPVSLDRFYSFRLEGDKLINTTIQARQKLSEILMAN